MFLTPESKVQKLKRVNFCKRIREKVTKNGVTTRFPHQKVWILCPKKARLGLFGHLLSPKIIGMFGPRTAIVASKYAFLAIFGRYRPCRLSCSPLVGCSCGAQKQHFGAEEVLTSDRRGFTAGVFFCIFKKKEVYVKTHTLPLFKKNLF